MTVPTTGSRKSFDGKPLESALRGIGKGLTVGSGVSIESSVPPTTTEKWARRILEEESGLVVEKDFALVFSPERIYEGRALADLEERYPKIVGGVGPRSTELFATLYSRIAKKGGIKMSSATAAELSKLFEGVYRDVNIALANELAKLCEALNVDFAEVREASNSQPFSHLHKPGVGVGGACIPTYPYFVMGVAEENDIPMPLTRLSREINEKMPEYTVLKAEEALKTIGKNLSNSKVAILGLAFRGDTADCRNSPTYDLVDLLRGRSGVLIVQDPFVAHDEALNRKGVKLTKSIEEAVESASLIIVAADHSEYRKADLGLISKLADLPVAVVDGRNMIAVKQPLRGIYLTGLGRKPIGNI